MRKEFLILLSAVIFLCMIFNIPLSAGNPTQDLQSGVQKKDSSKVKKAVEGLVLQNDVKACNTLLDALTPQPDTNIYWLILEGISRFSNSEAISKITNFILSKRDQDVGRDLLGAMKSNRSPNILPLLKEVMEKAPEDLKTECLHQLGGIQTKEALEVLFNFLETLDEKNDKLLTKETIGAVKRITGLDKGNYQASWLAWWKENKDKQISDIIKPKTAAGGNIDNVSQYRDMTGVEDLPKEKVFVVRNDRCDKHYQGDRNYDKIQDVLTKMGVDHTVLGKSELESDSFNWKEAWALVFNCNYYKDLCCGKGCGNSGQAVGARVNRCVKSDDPKHDHMTHDTELSKKTIQKIKEFVESGGYLFTEDLNIREITGRSFKGVITDTKEYSDRTVQILPAPGAVLHPYLKYVFEAPPSSSSDAPGMPGMPPSEEKSGETRSVKPGEFRIDSEWKIDNGSPDIKILGKNVTVLIMSPKLVDKSHPEGAVAVTWGVSGENIVSTDGNKTSYSGGGRVLHVMSHFGHQRSKIDEFALQNLLLNFLIELNQRRPKSKK
ncbi:MAG: hypothetical protein HZA49_01880 [Planctomycetes bacterium]|nr:hypothetical protein [Planctomycetota bacterium]